MVVSCSPPLKVTLSVGYHYCPHFIDEETESLKGSVTRPGHTASEWRGLDLHPFPAMLSSPPSKGGVVSHFRTSQSFISPLPMESFMKMPFLGVLLGQELQTVFRYKEHGQGAPEKTGQERERERYEIGDCFMP